MDNQQRQMTLEEQKIINTLMICTVLESVPGVSDKVATSIKGMANEIGRLEEIRLNTQKTLQTVSAKVHELSKKMQGAGSVVYDLIDEKDFKPLLDKAIEIASSEHNKEAQPKDGAPAAPQDDLKKPVVESKNNQPEIRKVDYDVAADDCKDSCDDCNCKKEDPQDNVISINEANNKKVEDGVGAEIQNKDKEEVSQPHIAGEAGKTGVADVVKQIEEGNRDEKNDLS